MNKTEDLLERCPAPFKYIVGKVIELNKKHWLEDPNKKDLIGTDEVKKNGGLTHQDIDWIEETLADYECPECDYAIEIITHEVRD